MSSKEDPFLPVRSQFDTKQPLHVSTATYCQSAAFGPLAFCVSPFFYDKNTKEFRIATVAMLRCDLYAAVFPQMSPTPPTKNCGQLRTTTRDYAHQSTMVDFIVLSIKLVFMVLGVSYSRVLAQRPTGCCSTSSVLNVIPRLRPLAILSTFYHVTLQTFTYHGMAWSFVMQFYCEHISSPCS